MKITFLGTGTSQGIPVIGCRCEACTSSDPRDKRLRSSVLVENEGLNIVIDTGPDFRQQMLRSRVQHLDAILFTHEHRDHIAGLDDIRAFNFIQKKPMDVYAEERVFNALKHEFSYVFAADKYPGIPRINEHVITNNPFRIGNLEIIPIRMKHLELPVLGYRIGNFAYLTDGNLIPEEEKEKIKGVDYLSISSLRREKHISHFTLSEVLVLFEEISPRKGYLTHISHQIGPYVDLQKELPENVIAAYDDLVLDL